MALRFGGCVARWVCGSAVWWLCGSVGVWLGGSVNLKGPGFEYWWHHFGILAIPFTRLYQCLLEETLKTVSPFYLVSVQEEVKDPTQGGECVICRGLHNCFHFISQCTSQL